MIVLFERTLTEDAKTDLIIEKLNDEIYLKIEYTDFANRNLDRKVGHFLTKEELKEFIGALLHIQSKFRK
tara:strand:+ start:161 stop:370 length:210 start_codon:yes stop_codon:yes gene_type:complete